MLLPRDQHDSEPSLSRTLQRRGFAFSGSIGPASSRRLYRITTTEVSATPAAFFRSYK